GPEPRPDAVAVELEGRGQRAEPAPVAAVELEGLLERERIALEERRALRQLAGEVLLPRLDLAPQLVAPRREAVGPGIDREAPDPAAVDLEVRHPAVVARVVHRRPPPAPPPRLPYVDRRSEHVWLVSDESCRDSVLDS